VALLHDPLHETRKKPASIMRIRSGVFRHHQHIFSAGSPR
jgi:hypothetical protein